MAKPKGGSFGFRLTAFRTLQVPLKSGSLYLLELSSVFAYFFRATSARRELHEQASGRLKKYLFTEIDCRFFEANLWVRNYMGISRQLYGYRKFMGIRGKLWVKRYCAHIIMEEVTFSNFIM